MTAVTRSKKFWTELFGVSRQIVEGGSYAVKRLRCRCQGLWIKMIKASAPHTCDVRWPSGLQFGQPSRCEFCNIASSISRTCTLGNKSSPLKIVYKASRSARREPRSNCKVGHPQLTVGRLGQTHDYRVLARGQACCPDHVAVQLSWQ